MAGMFDPVYVTEVINDILGRRGLHLTLIPKESAGPGQQDPRKSAVPNRDSAATLSLDGKEGV